MKKQKVNPAQTWFADERAGCPVHVYVQKEGGFDRYRSYPTSHPQTPNEISLLFDFELQHYDALLRE